MSAAFPTSAYASRPAAWPQRAAARLVGSRLFWALFIGTVFTLPLVRSIRKQLPPAPSVLGAMPAFQLVDEAGSPFGLERLNGHLTIAEFAPADAVRTVSPLSQLQRRVRNTGNAVHLVSFVRDAVPQRGPSSAAPEPPGATAALAAVARDAHAGAWRWTFAGGAGVAALEEAVSKTLGRSVDGALLLVDARGRIRRVISPTPAEIDSVMRDIGLLANVPDAPLKETRTR